MYERFKSYIDRYSWVTYLIMAGVACLCCWIIYGGSSDNSSTVEHLERAKGQQRESLNINKDVTDSVERSTQLNREAGDRIVRAQEYQQRASESLIQGTKRLDEAEAILERNEQLIRDVEQGHQTKQGNGTTATPPKKYVGVDQWFITCWSSCKIDKIPYQFVLVGDFSFIIQCTEWTQPLNLGRRMVVAFIEPLAHFFSKICPFLNKNYI